MPYTVIATLDPKTMQPIQQTNIVRTQQPAQKQQQQPQISEASQFNVSKYAAESAADQMNEAAKRGGMVTMEDFENARKKAFDEAMGFQRWQSQQMIQKQLDLQAKQAEELIVKRMPDPQIESASAKVSSADTIMQLYNMHKDALTVPGFGQAIVGGAAGKAYDLFNPKVRAFNSLTEGTLTSIARGVVGDTGVQASEPSAQTGVRILLPNDQDNETMGGIKTITLLQKVLTNMADQARGLRNNNINSTSMADDYTRIYNQYKDLVGKYALDSQLDHPAASPDEVFGSGEAAKSYIAKGAASLRPPVVTAGVSEPGSATIDAVNFAAAGRKGGAYSMPPGYGPQPIASDQGTPQPAQGTAGAYSIPPTYSGQGTMDVSAEHERAIQAAQNLPRNVLASVQNIPGQVGQAAGQTWQFLSSLFPENWPKEAYDKPRPWEVVNPNAGAEYVGQ